MALRVSGKNLAIGEALRRHVGERIAAASAKYAAGDVFGHVTIGPEGSGFRTDGTLHLTSGRTLQVAGQAQEPYTCVNLAVERFDKRLRRYRRRLRDRQGIDVAAKASNIEAFAAIREGRSVPATATAEHDRADGRRWIDARALTT